MTRDEAQPIWEKIVDIGLSDYSKLTRKQRIWFNLEPLTTDGLWDHYVNYGADKNSDTIEDLDFLSFESIANHLRKFNNKYFPNGVPQGPHKRQIQLNDFPEKELELDIQKMDNHFWEIYEELEISLLVNIINAEID